MNTRYWKLPVFREIPVRLEDLTRGDLAAYIREKLSREYAEERAGA